jgi:hypothetical protein
LVNIFGGIMKCDTIATGVITACKAVNLSVPLVVRMKGTNEELGKKMLAESGLPIISADTMALLDPAVENRADFRLLRGAANFLISRNEDAERDFAYPAFNDNDEGEFWRAIGQAITGLSAFK